MRVLCLYFLNSFLSFSTLYFKLNLKNTTERVHVTEVNTLSLNTFSVKQFSFLAYL